MVRQTVLSVLVFGYTVCVMLGLGSSIDIDVWAELRKAPKAVACGFASQFGFMPLLAFCLCLALGLGDTEAIALLLLGMCPGGVTSTLFVYGCGANVTVSVVMTTVSTLAALFMMPFLIFVYMRPPLVSSNDSRVDYTSIVATLFIATLPALIGWRVRRARPKLGKVLEVAATRIGFVLVLVAVIAVAAWPSSDGHGSITFKAIVVMILMCPCGFLLGYAAATLVGLDQTLARTVSIETGIQQVGIAGAIAINSFNGQQLDKMVTLMVIFGAITFFAGCVWSFVLARLDRRYPATTTAKDAPSKDLEEESPTSTVG